LKRSKPFDAVEMMRTIRDQMGREIAGMTPAQEIEYIRQRACLLEKEGKGHAHPRRTARRVQTEPVVVSDKPRQP
jgi:hypothetical protein